jgi:hypothetical protein
MFSPSDDNKDSFIFPLNSFGWQCCFHPIDPNLLFAGTANNDLYQFDLRAPSLPVNIYTIPNTKGKGIHSVSCFIMLVAYD